MSTEKTIRDYFAAIHRGGWQDFLAEDMTYGFNSALQDLGKEDYLNGAGNFLAMTIDVDVKHLVIDGDQAAVISDYFVKTPGRNHRNIRGSRVFDHTQRQADGHLHFLR